MILSDKNKKIEYSEKMLVDKAKSKKKRILNVYKTGNYIILIIEGLFFYHIFVCQESDLISF